VRTFGVLKLESEDWLTRLLRRLVTAGLVVFTGEERPIVMLTEAGRAVMEGRQTARVLLPSRAPRARKGKGRAPYPSTPPVRFSSEPTVYRTPDAEAQLDDASLELFEALRAHRLSVARAESVPPFVVASDRTLRDMARARPLTESQLLSVYGMGPVKAARYGAGFLAIVQERCG
jgi:ATP-dependent DNA helicase RecQ